MAIQIDIEALIMANQLIFQINRFYGENLRVYQNILWQSQVKACQRLLCVRADEPAAGLLKAVSLRILFINRDNFILRLQEARERCAGRSHADDGNII